MQDTNSLPALPTPPDIKPRQKTLANGMRVISLEEHSSPNVSIQVWYNVSGKDDPAGRAGFAHLFEHLLFKKTRNLPDKQWIASPKMSAGRTMPTRRMT